MKDKIKIRKEEPKSKEQLDDDDGQMDSNLRLQEQEPEQKTKQPTEPKEEDSKETKVSYSACLDYFSFCTTLLGGRYSVFLIILLHILINLSVSSLSLYLAFALKDLAGSGEGNQATFDSSLLLIMSATFAITVLGKYVSCLIFMSINRNMHQKVMSSLINTKMAFFDENTSGAIINRLSADIQVTDEIVFNFLEMIDYIIKCLFSLAFIVLSSPWTLFVVFFQLYYFYRLRKRILNITRDCFRLKQELNAPVISLITDSVNGQVTMRALGARNYFLREFFKHSNSQTRAFVTSNGVNRYSAFRIDM